MLTLNKKDTKGLHARGAIIGAQEPSRVVVLGRSKRDGSCVMVCRVAGDGLARRVELVSMKATPEQSLVYEMAKASRGYKAPVLVVTGEYDEVLAERLRYEGQLSGVFTHSPAKACEDPADAKRFANRRAACAHRALEAVKDGRVAMVDAPAALRAELIDQLRHVEFSFTDMGKLKVEHGGGKGWSLLSVAFGDFSADK